MRNITHQPSAKVCLNDKFFIVDTYSYYGSTVGDPEGESIILQRTASNIALGEAVLKALAKSRFLDDPLIRRELMAPDNLLRNYEIYVTRLMSVGGYKTRRALFQKMRACTIDVTNGEINIAAMHHAKSEAWSGAPRDGQASLRFDSAPQDIGRVLRECLRKCTGPGAAVPDAESLRANNP